MRFIPNGGAPRLCINSSQVLAKHLEFVNTRRGSIEFKYAEDRIDVENAPRLEEVSFKINDEVLKKVNFDNNHYYTSLGNFPIFNYGVSESVRYRLRLKGLQESNNASSIPPYVFEYADETASEPQLPPRLSFQQDHWGYYNNNSEPGLIPPPPLDVNGLGFSVNADRETNSSLVGAGMLARITYPTGLTSEFEFECNRAGYLDREGQTFCENRYTEIGNSVTASFLANQDVKYRTDESTFTLLEGGSGTVSWYAYKGDAEDTQDQENIGCHGDHTITFELYLKNGDIWDPIGLPVGASCVTKEDPIGLGPGTYKLYIKANSLRDNGYCSISIIDKQRYCDTPGQYVGGVRIKKTQIDGLIRTYDYNDETGRSSGILISKPIYRYGINYSCEYSANIGCSFYAMNSASIVPLGYTKGGHIGYTNVKEIIGATGEYGSIAYEYSFYHDDPDRYNWPYGPSASNDFRRGALLSKHIRNESGELVQLDKFNYTFGRIEGKSSSSFGLFSKNYNIEALTCPDDRVDKVYYVFSEWVRLNSSKKNDLF